MAHEGPKCSWERVIASNPKLSSGLGKKRSDMSLTPSGHDEAVPGFYDTGPPDAQGFIPFRFPAGRFNANFPSERG
jgi:hypothetical protein